MNIEREHVDFHMTEDSTKEDWDRLVPLMGAWKRDLATRVLAQMETLRGESNMAIDLYDHSLQSATRAYRDNKDDEYIVFALLHDIGAPIASYNHEALVCTMLAPFTDREDYLWMTEHHGIFQGYYYFHHIGLDRNKRDEFLGHPWYDLTVEFCHEYDQRALDPTYKNMALQDFEPAVRAFFGSPKVRERDEAGRKATAKSK